jgi:hypothetical protein
LIDLANDDRTNRTLAAEYERGGAALITQKNPVPRPHADAVDSKHRIAKRCILLRNWLNYKKLMSLQRLVLDRGDDFSHNATDLHVRLPFQG